MIALLEQVEKAIHDPQNQILSELLGPFVDKSLTEVNLRGKRVRQAKAQAGLVRRDDDECEWN